jgi:hypothetical protein
MEAGPLVSTEHSGHDTVSRFIRLLFDIFNLKTSVCCCLKVFAIISRCSATLQQKTFSLERKFKRQVPNKFNSHLFSIWRRFSDLLFQSAILEFFKVNLYWCNLWLSLLEQTYCGKFQMTSFINSFEYIDLKG